MSQKTINMEEGLNESQSPKGDGETILVIEDDEMQRSCLQAELDERGYRVIPASDGTDGIRAFRKNINDVSLVILDMGLPEMNGEEVLSTILGSNSNIKVIVVSGSIYPEVQTGVIRNGAAAYLSKPYLTSTLLLEVDHVLHGKKKNG